MFATFTSIGSRAALDPHRVRAQGPLDPPRDDLVLLAVLGRLAELLAQMVIDGRIGAAAGRASERDRLGSRTPPSDE